MLVNTIFFISKFLEASFNYCYHEQFKNCRAYLLLYNCFSMKVLRRFKLSTRLLHRQCHHLFLAMTLCLTDIQIFQRVRFCWFPHDFTWKMRFFEFLYRSMTLEYFRLNIYSSSILYFYGHIQYHHFYSLFKKSIKNYLSFPECSFAISPLSM